MNARELLKAVAVTAELTQTQLSDIAQATMVEELMSFGEQAVTVALVRCRRELRPGQFTLGAVLERIDDGRPTSDEAWAVSLDAQDERLTVVRTAEMVEAFAICRPILDSGDKIGARMAFKSAYERIVRDARLQNRPIQWHASLGWDQEGRTAVLTKAVETRKLSAEHVSGLLPSPSDTGPIGALLLGDKNASLRLVCKDGEKVTESEQERIRTKCAELLDEINRRNELNYQQFVEWERQRSERNRHQHDAVARAVSEELKKRGMDAA